MSADNQEQADYWNGEAGDTWVESVERIDRTLLPVTEVLLERSAAQPGERALDVGCGCGTTSLALADRGASVWGVDLSETMIETAKARANERAQRLGQGAKPDVAFSCADASSQALTPDHNLILSRFGVMFFADPVAAFANLRAGSAPGGRLCFAAWRPTEQNPWMAIPGKAVAPFLPPPTVVPDPRGPGPFAFADDDYVRSLLGQAGWSDIQTEPLAFDFHLGDCVEDAMAFQKRIGPVSRAISELSGAAQDKALAAAHAALAEHATDEGVDLGAAVWLVTASS